jgi:CTP-dependent riboflavin kinase
VNAEAVNWARRQKAGGAVEKCVLLNLALGADDKGVCLVSRADLAQRAELSRSAVERALQTLRANGLIGRDVAAEFVEIRLMTDREEGGGK